MAEYKFLAKDKVDASLTHASLMRKKYWYIPSNSHTSHILQLRKKLLVFFRNALLLMNPRLLCNGVIIIPWNNKDR